MNLPVRGCGRGIALGIIALGFATTAAAGSAVGSTMVLAAAPTEMPVIQQSGTIRYLSGGVGDEERTAMNQVENQFNLGITLATANGSFLSDAQIRISDSKGSTVLETVPNGPMLFVQLPPGEYKVDAQGFGQHYSKTVHVGERMSKITFTWPAQG